MGRNFDDFEDFTPGEIVFLRQLMALESRKTKPVESKIKLIDAVMTILPHIVEGEDVNINMRKSGGSVYVSIRGKSINIKKPYIFSKIVQTSPCIEVGRETNGTIELSLGYYKVFTSEDR